MPQTPMPGRGYGAPLQTPPLGAPALRASFDSGPSAPPSSPDQKSWIHPWAHPPSENSGYVYAREKCAVEKLESSLPKKLGARPQPHPPHRNPGSATVLTGPYRPKGTWLERLCLSYRRIVLFIYYWLNEVTTNKYSVVR